MRLASEGVVLSRWPFRESSLVVGLFLRREGYLRAVARGARRPRSPFRGALEPFARVEAEVLLKEGAELGTLVRCDLVEGSVDLFSVWPRAQVLEGIRDVLERGLPPLSREEETFRLVRALLTALRGGMDPRLAWVYFLAWFLRLHGVAENLPAVAPPGAAELLGVLLRRPPREVPPGALSHAPALAAHLRRFLERYLGGPLRAAPPLEDGASGV